MKNYLSGILEKIYKIIFGGEITPRVRSFSMDLQVVAVGTGIGSFLGLIFQILAGRLLGPAEYGKYSLIQSIAMILYVPMILGFNTAMVKYNSEKEDVHRHTSIISTTYIIVIALTVVSSVFFFLFQDHFTLLFHISGDVFRLAVIFAIFFTFYTITTETARGLFKMKIFAIFQSAYAIILLLALLLLVFSKTILSFKSVVYSTFLAYGVVGVLLLAVFLRKYLKLSFSKEWAGTLTKYSLWAVVGGISFAVYSNVDKILINKYMTIADLGIYKAYYLSSISFSSIFSGVFLTVFFPTASRHEDKKDILNKIKVLIPYLFVVGVPFISICEYVILKFYGSGYSINFPLLLMFAFATVLIIWYGLYDWTFCSEGIKGIKLINMGTVTVAILNFLLNIFLVPVFGLYGAAGSILLSFSAGLACIYLLKSKLVYE